MTRLFASILLLLGGCSNPTVPIQPPSFDRPESLSFFCWNKEERTTYPLDRCLPVAPEAGTEDLGRPDEPFELHAVVTQTASGEAAAVQVTTDVQDDTSGVVDSDVRLPGFTFAAVGEVPSAVVTPTTSPEFTYVVSRGSSDLAVIETSSFRDGLGANVTIYDAEELGWAPLSRPSAMVLTPDEDALIVALPETGQIARVPIDGSTIGEAELLDLEELVPAPVDLSVLMNSERPPEYLYSCPGASSAIQETVWAPPREQIVGDVPIPWALVIDEEENTVLVADRGLPIIHVVALETMVEGAAISTSVPTRDLALTPRVPATVTDEADPERTERFIYAIDEIDRSVLAIDYSDRARPSFGGVLSMRAIAPYDRLTLPEPVVAQSIAVVSPAYDETGELTYCTDKDEASPLQLHGVFLTVACSDGRVRFFDIYDLDTSCRGTTECATIADPDSADEVVAIARHRPRIGHFVDEPVRVTPDPVWQLGNVVAAVEDDGTNAQSDEAPALSAVECPSPLAQVYPAIDNEASPLVCAVTDPFSARPQVVAATYEGVIPGTPSSGGNYDDAMEAIEVRFNPCQLGVIGADDVPDSGYLAGYEGDVVAITGRLPLTLSEEEHDLCRPIVDENDALEITPLLFRVRSARAGGLRPTYGGVIELGEPLGDYSAADVGMCYPELLELEVRTSDSFIVLSSIHGLLHPIVAGETDGRCTVDAARAASFERGRAFFGEEFRAPFVSFSLGARPPSIEQAAITFSIGEVPSPLALEIGADTSNVPSLLTELVYNPIDERLYVIDQAVSGLVRVRLTDLGTQGRFR
jgi:hypothetical protein